MFRHVDFVQAPKFCGPQHLGLYEIHMPKHRNPQHIGLHEIHEVHKLAAVVVRGKRRRHHFQVANASDRLHHCDDCMTLRPTPLKSKYTLRPTEGGAVAVGVFSSSYGAEHACMRRTVTV